jgi:biopolymer transport protein ExbD
MKLETTLEERPGFLHALPLFDLFALATMLLLLGPMFLSQSGISVEMPTSRFQMQRYGDTVVVTVGPGSTAAPLYLGRRAITLKELPERLAELREDERMSRAIVLLKADVRTTVGMERRVSELILAAGFKLALVGDPEPTVDAGKPEPSGRAGE